MKNRLSDLAIRRAKPRERAFYLYDGEGLQLYVPPSGASAWQFVYRHDGKRQTATLGRLAGMSLAEARVAAESARTAAREGRHVTAVQRAQRARNAAATTTANTFGGVAEQWREARGRKMQWTPDYAEEVKASIERHLKPLLKLPMAEIDATMTTPIIAAADRAAPAMARKVEQRLLAIFDHAVRGGVIRANPLPRPERTKQKGRHYPSVVDRDGVGAIIRAADQAECFRGVRRVHWICMLTVQRIGVVMRATWDQFDLEAGLWTIPRPGMKTKTEERGDHVVPLGPRMLAMLRAWRKDDGDGVRYVARALNADKPITHEAVEKFYREKLGLRDRHNPHSWRTVFKTWSADAGKDDDAVESQLDHKVGDDVQSAYDRAKRLKRRAVLIRWYEGQIFLARDGAEVVTLRA